MYVLEVLSGPLDGKTWTFEREIEIGRDETLVGACITLDRYVSRRHASVLVDGGAVVVRDLSSRNGTQVGGEPVTRRALAADGRFTVGRTLLRVVRG